MDIFIYELHTFVRTILPVNYQNKIMTSPKIATQKMQYTKQRSKCGLSLCNYEKNESYI